MRYCPNYARRVLWKGRIYRWTRLIDAMLVEVADCRMGKEGNWRRWARVLICPCSLFRIFTAFSSRFDYSRQVSQRFVVPRIWKGGCTWLWTIIIMFYYTTVHGNNQVCPVPDCRMGKKGLETMSQGAHLPMLIFLQFFTALFLNRFDYSRQVSQRFVMPRTWNGWCTWLWTIFSWCFPVLDGEVSTCTSVSSHPYRPSKVSQICVSMNIFTLGRGPTSARYVDPPQSGYQL